MNPCVGKALTVRQPWASLIAEGIKIVETRSWSTKYRGPIAIHAGLHRPETWHGEEGPYGEFWDDDDECLVQWAQSEKRDFIPGRVPPPNLRWWISPAPEFPSLTMPLGFVVATCQLADVCRIDATDKGVPSIYSEIEYFGGHHNLADQVPYGDFTPGRFAWILTDVQKVDDSFPATGKQGLWKLPEAKQ